jgi:hypothetical protein
MTIPFRRLARPAFAAISLIAGNNLPALNGPDYAPPFELSAGKRQAADLVSTTFLDKRNGNQPAESATLVVGNKRIAVREFERKHMTSRRDSVLPIFVNEELVFNVVFAGTYRNAEGKWIQFVQKFTPETTSLQTDQQSGIIRWSNRYALPDGKPAEFSYQLKSLGDSRVELSWDVGYTEAQIQEYKNLGNTLGGCIVYFELPESYRKAGIEINGRRPQLNAVEKLKQSEGKKVALWSGELKSLVYNPDKPLNRFTLLSDDGLKGACTEIFHYRRVNLGFQMGNNKPRGKIIIDFGTTAEKKADAPPPVEGHDLWAQDALHMPLPPTRNLFPNPSFEQGLRYWRWWSGGATYTPSEVTRYGIDPENGLFGKNAMVINPTQRYSANPRSFSLPGQKGKTYTVSFHARAEKPGATLKLAPFSSKTGGQFDRGDTGRFKAETLSSDWKRYSYSFVSDGAPLALILMAADRGGKIWLDGIQYEAGDQATEFVSAPLEGRLFTSHPDNNLELGQRINAEFAVSGKSGTAGTADFTLMNFYKNTLWEQSLKAKADERLNLPFDSLNLATGTYILRVRYRVPGSKPYFDFYRFTIINSLDGTHATKDLYGALFSARISRAEDCLDLIRRLGFGGSTSYGPGKLRNPYLYELREKYNVTGYTHELIGAGGVHLTNEQRRARHPDYLFAMSIDSRIWRKPEERKSIKVLEYYSEDVLKRVEALAEKAAREHPYVRVWSIATEEEGTIPALRKRRDFAEFAKLQVAFYRGIKRGNPKAMGLPSGGTSGYGKIRGRAEIEGYLAATQGKVKWDAVAIHPYGSIDGTLGAGDLDESIQMLSDSMAKYGYGKETPILLNEGGGGSAAVWGDGPAYSYSGGQPSYDQGLHEFLNAAKMARQYIICLKYWPRLPHFNSWQSDQRMIVDVNLTPTSYLLGINTLGHLLAKPEFVADIRPAPGMRGYAFKDDQGRGVAALWCTNDDVERGFMRGPLMRVKFTGKLPELVDLMGKSYALKKDSDGWVEFQLTPAPFFLRGDDPQKLAQALKDADVVGAGAGVKVTFAPTLTGGVTANIENLTGREQAGSLVIDGKDIAFKVPGKQTQPVALPGKAMPEANTMFRWNTAYQLKQAKAAPLSQQWNMDYFYVPHCEGTPDWKTVPGFKMDNLYRPVVKMKQTPGGHPGDIAATFKMAWNADNLYLRVEAEDDIFDIDNPKFWNSPEARKNQLYILDGCLEVYFDCGANGRLRKGGFDLDDYRYDFCVGNPEGQSGPALVNRLQEVFTEYGGGVEFPTKEEAAKGIKAEFTRVLKTRYAYTITFAQKYLEPLRLQTGSVAGFALYLHDRMDDGTIGDKGLSLATEPGSHCDRKPQVWPLMILGK